MGTVLASGDLPALTRVLAGGYHGPPALTLVRAFTEWTFDPWMTALVVILGGSGSLLRVRCVTCSSCVIAKLICSIPLDCWVPHGEFRFRSDQERRHRVDGAPDIRRGCPKPLVFHRYPRQVLLKAADLCPPGG